MNRDQLIQMRNKAMIALSTARGMGYSDDEILSSLKGGNEREREFAAFLEHEIMKGENYIPVMVEGIEGKSDK